MHLLHNINYLEYWWKRLCVALFPNSQYLFILSILQKVLLLLCTLTVVLADVSHLLPPLDLIELHPIQDNLILPEAVYSQSAHASQGYSYPRPIVPFFLPTTPAPTPKPTYLPPRPVPKVITTKAPLPPPTYLPPSTTRATPPPTQRGEITVNSPGMKSVIVRTRSFAWKVHRSRKLFP